MLTILVMILGGSLIGDAMDCVREIALGKASGLRQAVLLVHAGLVAGAGCLVAIV